MKVINNRFGILLAEKRIKERRPISLAEVADATGISRKTLYAWENNKVTRYDVPVIDALCKYFEIEPGDLFQYVREENRSVADQEWEYVEVVTKAVSPKKVAKESLPKETRRKKQNN
jgi:putative transcriptional regulator